MTSSSNSSTTSIPTDAAAAPDAAPGETILPNVGGIPASSSSTTKSTRTTTNTILASSSTTTDGVTVLPLPSPVKGKADWRQYRCVQLVGTGNHGGGVTVCAVHDPQSKTSAAAATVHAGAAMDPRDMPGLARE